MHGPAYLRPPRGKFWDFDASGEAVEWSLVDAQNDSRTIALSIELGQILRALLRELGGLPELTTILFLIAASRENSDPRWLSRQVELLQTFGGTISTDTSGGTDGVDQDTDHRRRVFKLFRYLRELRRQDCRDLGQNFLTLFETPLVKSRRIDHEEAEVAIEWLLMNPAERPNEWAPANHSIVSTEVFLGNQPDRQSLYRVWNCLDLISRVPIDLDEAILRLKVGVGTVPEPADVEPIEDDQFAGLIAKLRSDVELGEIADSAYQVASVVSLPLAPSDPSELPIGGVSDISNRGNPERLLATELAADPMMLLARIANGQALYLRRESPPDHGVRARQILIENSVRTWGQTRVRLLAVALGLASSEQSRGQSEVEIGTLAGDDYVVEDFSSRAGMIEHLGRLAATPHPGVALLQWAGAQDDADADQELPVLILSQGTWSDPDFHVAIRELDRQWLVACVDHHGELHLFRSDSAGEHSLRRIRLDQLRLDERSRPTDTALGDLPAFVRQSVSPLRFGLNSAPTWCAASSQLLWVRSSADRLLCFDAQGQGARAVLDRFSVTCINAHLAAENRLELVVTQSNEFRYVKVDRTVGVIENHKIRTEPESHFFFDRGSLFARKGKTLWLIDKHSGAILDQVECQGIQVNGCPFSYDPISGVTIYSNAGNRIESHSFPNQKIDPPALGFRDTSDVPSFVSAGMSRIITVDPDHPDRIITNRVDAKFRMAKLLGVSARRDKVVVSGSQKEKVSGTTTAFTANYCVDLKTGYANRVHLGESRLDLLTALGEPVIGYFRQLDTLTRFVGAGIDPKGLFLMPRSGRIPKRMSTDGNPVWESDRSISIGAGSRFGDAFYVDAAPDRAVCRAGKSRVNWKLRKLLLGDAILWLDSRGLLHLASRQCDRQMTLVLSSRKLAGWFSEGEVFGDPYFLNSAGSFKPWSSAAEYWYASWIQDARTGQG